MPSGRFLTQPAVRATLLGLKHVDLTMVESETRLDDPFLTNSWGLDGQPLVDIPNQVAELLTQAAGAASVGCHPLPPANCRMEG